jgi:hypothetical protein
MKIEHLPQAAMKDCLEDLRVVLLKDCRLIEGLLLDTELCDERLQIRAERVDNPPRSFAVDSRGVDWHTI